MKTMFTFILFISNLAFAQASSTQDPWQKSRNSSEIAVAILAPGLTQMDIYSQVGVLLSNNTPISKIVILNPDVSADQIVQELQLRYPGVEISVENSK